MPHFFVFIFFFFLIITSTFGLVCRSFLIFHSRKGNPEKKEAQCFRRKISEFVFPIHLLGPFFAFPYCLQSLWNFPSTQKSEDAQCSVLDAYSTFNRKATHKWKWILHTISLTFSCFLPHWVIQQHQRTYIHTFLRLEKCAHCHINAFIYIYSLYDIPNTDAKIENEKKCNQINKDPCVRCTFLMEILRFVWRGFFSFFSYLPSLSHHLSLRFHSQLAFTFGVLLNLTHI